MSITDHYFLVKDSIQNKLKSISRDFSEIEFIAVSKKQSEEKIIQLLNCGHRVFGENQIQEVESKWLNIKKHYSNIKLCLIGSIQSRKVKKICELCDEIHSVDREKIVQIISDLKLQGLKIPKLFLQVNIGSEIQKSGVNPSEVKNFIDMSLERYNISYEGLMCLPPEGKEPKKYFDQLRDLSYSNNLNQLSMGMSGDYLTALDCGATHIRVGSLIFGERN